MSFQSSKFHSFSIKSSVNGLLVFAVNFYLFLKFRKNVNKKKTGDPNKSLQDPNIAGETWCFRCRWEDLTFPLVLNYADVMREEALKREKEETLKLIAKKKKQQEEEEVAPEKPPTDSSAVALKSQEKELVGPIAGRWRCY